MEKEKYADQPMLEGPQTTRKLHQYLATISGKEIGFH